MATLYSDKITAGNPAREMPSGVLSVSAEYTVTAALALNDVIQMVKVPQNATVTEVVLSSTDLDTGGSPAIVLDVGDTGDTDRLIDGATIGQAGGLTRTNVHTGHFVTYSAETTISVLVQVAPATGATSGTIRLTVFYTMDK
jgi:hypothetical protein